MERCSALFNLSPLLVIVTKDKVLYAFIRSLCISWRFHDKFFIHPTFIGLSHVSHDHSMPFIMHVVFLFYVCVFVLWTQVTTTRRVIILSMRHHGASCKGLTSPWVSVARSMAKEMVNFLGVILFESQQPSNQMSRKWDWAPVQNSSCWSQNHKRHQIISRHFNCPYNFKIWPQLSCSSTIKLPNCWIEAFASQKCMNTLHDEFKVFTYIFNALMCKFGYFEWSDSCAD